ncbi:unnamed protein product [Blepharisma stoltei]|uniref:Uncharacterized protein n=1 Tax=Blepharisma stoltei TaxID=1481888 RepID=A0AAU9IEE3_9CILI|nr:unnamed protein product [Blepharisma stoltei]
MIYQDEFSKDSPETNKFVNSPKNRRLKYRDLSFSDTKHENSPKSQQRLDSHKKDRSLSFARERLTPLKIKLNTDFLARNSDEFIYQSQVEPLPEINVTPIRWRNNESALINERRNSPKSPLTAGPIDLNEKKLINLFKTTQDNGFSRMKSRNEKFSADYKANYIKHTREQEIKKMINKTKKSQYEDQINLKINNLKKDNEELQKVKSPTNAEINEAAAIKAEKAALEDALEKQKREKEIKKQQKLKEEEEMIKKWAHEKLAEKKAKKEKEKQLKMLANEREIQAQEVQLSKMQEKEASVIETKKILMKTMKDMEDFEIRRQEFFKRKNLISPELD